MAHSKEKPPGFGDPAAQENGVHKNTLFIPQSPPSSQALCILGVDPGQGGALAFYFPSHPERVSVHDMPIAGEQVDAATLAAIIRQMRPDVAFIEAVHSLPKQRVASSFKFGRSFGVAIGVISALQIPSHFVSSGRWKKHFRLPADKEQARALALQMGPLNGDMLRRRKDEDRAEAALIALYGSQTIGGAR